VVILATPAVFRPIHFEYAVQKGVNVFMEKSFAVDAPQVRRLMQASAESEKKNLKVGVGFMWRHSQARQEVIQRIHDGAIGDVHTLRIYRVHGPHHCGKFAGGNEMEFQLRKFMSFNWASGGFFVDWHCHNVDVACWAKNAWPVSAQGMGGRTYPEAGNLFDQYTVEFTFADGAKLFAFSRHMARCWSTYADYAHGSKGSAVLMANLTQPQTRIYKSQNMIDSEIAWRYTGKEESPYVREWQVLLEAIRENKPHNESRRGAEADLTAIMGRMAAHSGQLVTWDEALKSEFQYVPNVEQLTLDSTPPIKAGADGFYPVPIPGITREY
jgi:predicted dehydrogenase